MSSAPSGPLGVAISGASAALRIATISAPGNFSSTARTKGSAATPRSRSRAASARTSAMLGRPSRLDSATTQRSPVQSCSLRIRACGRWVEPPGASENSSRPRSNVTRRTSRSSMILSWMSRSAAARATTSSNFPNRARGSAVGAGAGEGAKARAPPVSPGEEYGPRAFRLADAGGPEGSRSDVRAAGAPALSGPPKPSLRSASSGVGRSAA